MHQIPLPPRPRRSAGVRSRRISLVIHLAPLARPFANCLHACPPSKLSSRHQIGDLRKRAHRDHQHLRHRIAIEITSTSSPRSPTSLVCCPPAPHLLAPAAPLPTVFVPAYLPCCLRVSRRFALACCLLLVACCSSLGPAACSISWHPPPFPTVFLEPLPCSPAVFCARHSCLLLRSSLVHCFLWQVRHCVIACLGLPRRREGTSVERVAFGAERTRGVLRARRARNNRRPALVLAVRLALGGLWEWL